MKLLRQLIAIASIFAISVADAAEQPAAKVAEPFTLTVVPSRSFPRGRSISFADDKPEEFFVVLTNPTKDIQPVFEYWNSWGYQNVSFEFTMPDGKKLVVSKRPQGFTKNFPSTFLIPPGEHRVYAIRLDKEWEVQPPLAAAETQITLKAIYEVAVTPEATEHKVWTGRIESKPYNLTLYHWGTPK
jgi:hypothetical protein